MTINNLLEITQQVSDPASWLSPTAQSRHTYSRWLALLTEHQD